jgi:ABC-type sugar transport system permease subunit
MSVRKQYSNSRCGLFPNTHTVLLILFCLYVMWDWVLFPYIGTLYLSVRNVNLRNSMSVRKQYSNSRCGQTNIKCQCKETVPNLTSLALYICLSATWIWVLFPNTHTVLLILFCLYVMWDWVLFPYIDTLYLSVRNVNLSRKQYSNSRCGQTNIKYQCN